EAGPCPRLAAARRLPAVVLVPLYRAPPGLLGPEPGHGLERHHFPQPRRRAPHLRSDRPPLAGRPAHRRHPGPPSPRLQPPLSERPAERLRHLSRWRVARSAHAMHAVVFEMAIGELPLTNQLGPAHLTHTKVRSTGQVRVRDAIAVGIDEQEALHLVAALGRYALPALIGERREPQALPDLQRLGRRPADRRERDLHVDGDGSQEPAAGSVLSDDPHAGDGLLLAVETDLGGELTAGRLDGSDALEVE